MQCTGGNSSFPVAVRCMVHTADVIFLFLEFPLSDDVSVANRRMCQASKRRYDYRARLDLANTV